MKSPKSMEAKFLVSSVPWIVGLVLFVKLPTVIILALAFVEIVIKCITTPFTTFSDDIKRDGSKWGAATYMLHPLFVAFSVAWRLMAAMVLLILAAMGSYLAIGIVMVVVAISIWVVGGISGWNDNAIYIVIMMLFIKALAIGTCIGLNIFIGPRIVSTYDKLYEIADSLREWLLVILWLAILALTVVFIIFTPLMWPIDVPQLLRIYPSGDLFGWTH